MELDSNRETSTKSNTSGPRGWLCRVPTLAPSARCHVARTAGGTWLPDAEGDTL